MTEMVRIGATVRVLELGPGKWEPITIAESRIHEAAGRAAQIGVGYVVAVVDVGDAVLDPATGELTAPHTCQALIWGKAHGRDAVQTPELIYVTVTDAEQIVAPRSQPQGHVRRLAAYVGRRNRRGQLSAAESHALRIAHELAHLDGGL